MNERLQQLEAENERLRTEVVRLRCLVRREVFDSDLGRMPYSPLEEQERERSKLATRRLLFGDDWQPRERAG